MNKDIKIILYSFVIFTLLDGIFIYINRNHFTEMLSKIQNKKVTMDIPSAIITYCFLYLGLYYFILKPRRDPFDAFLLGIVIYGVYEFTNRTIFSDWTLYTAIMDTLWGGILYATTTYIIYLHFVPIN
jgi:uncharacterized membrane protein